MPSPHWLIIWSNKISFYAVSITPDTLFPSQRSYSGENTASAIARSCASLALSLLVPVLVVWHKDDLVQVLSVLQAGLPGTPTADDSQAVQFHSGLALGMVLSSLQHQRLRLVLCVCSNDSNTGCKPSITYLHLYASLCCTVMSWFRRTLIFSSAPWKLWKAAPSTPTWNTSQCQLMTWCEVLTSWSLNNML